ncbi:MAG: hypothetical protein K2N27_12340 [Ruminococcus sp.]|nr:hypothetical protein [Ruminococcus sp.]
MKNIFSEVAKSENISEEEVKNEISKAVRIAMQSDSPQAKAFWSKIAPDGKEPSPEKVLEKLAEEFQKRKFYI